MSVENVMDSHSIHTRLALQFGYLNEQDEAKTIGHTLVLPTIQWPQTKRLVVTPRQSMTDEDWVELISLMREHRIIGLNAAGRLTDKALAQLAELDFISYLIFDGSRQVTDEGLLNLSRMPQLQQLDIGCFECGITDRGLQVLKHLTSLRDFKMCWQQGISDAGTSHLRFCERLESVNLMGTATGDETIRALAGKPFLKNLRTGRTVTDDGLAMLQEFPVFKNWQDGKTEYGMLSADAGPNHLMIDGPFSDKGLNSLAGLNGLFGFSIFWHSKSFSAGGLATIAALPHIGYLGLQDEHCNDEAMQHIGNMPKLRMLMAQGAVAGDKGFEALSRSQTLENIWGRDFTDLHNRGFKALSKMPALTGLAVSCKNVDEDGLSSLSHFPALKQITAIDIHDDGFRYIGACKQLESLVCMYCRDTTDLATSHVAGLQNIKKYYAGMTQITDKSLGILGTWKTLEEIELFKCLNITNAGISFLGNLPKLKKIELGAMPQVEPQATRVLTPDTSVEYWT